MPAALIAALFFTVALLVTHAYFLLGSVPLLILKHDTPMDASFVRSFFNTYYLAAMYIAREIFPLTSPPTAASSLEPFPCDAIHTF